MSFLDVRDIIEHADDDEAVALAELYGIDVGDGIEGDE